MSSLAVVDSKVVKVIDNRLEVGLGWLLGSALKFLEDQFVQVPLETVLVQQHVHDDLLVKLA